MDDPSVSSWTLPTFDPKVQAITTRAVRRRSGAIEFIVDDRMIVAKLDPADVAAFVSWLLGQR
jgi:hypothetical protein